jgi:hypothetical protein
VQIYLVKSFARWAKKHGVGNTLLECRAVELIRAIAQDNLAGHNLPLGAISLGGGIYKQRFPLPGKGSRSGARMIIAFRRGDSLFYLFGFKKKEQDNLTSDEERALKLVATTLLDMSESGLKESVKVGALVLIADTKKPTSG